MIRTCFEEITCNQSESNIKNIILIFPKRTLGGIKTTRGKANYCSGGNPFEDKINIIQKYFPKTMKIS